MRKHSIPAPIQGSTPATVEAPTSEAPKAAPIEDILNQAAAGFSFPSETDAPFTPFAWPQAGEEITIQNVALQLHLAQDSSVKQQSLDEFFARAVAQQDWMNADERATAQGLENLVQSIRANLPEATVFCIGEGSVDAFIVGRARQGLAGLQTKVVET